MARTRTTQTRYHVRLLAGGQLSLRPAGPSTGSPGPSGFRLVRGGRGVPSRPRYAPLQLERIGTSHEFPIVIHDSGSEAEGYLTDPSQGGGPEVVNVLRCAPPVVTPARASLPPSHSIAPPASLSMPASFTSCETVDTTLSCDPVPLANPNTFGATLRPPGLHAQGGKYLGMAQSGDSESDPDDSDNDSDDFDVHLN